MTLGAVFTDLDGTLLEPDGSLAPVAAAVVEELRRRRVQLVLLTSKSETELRGFLSLCGAVAGSFENGAGILHPGGREVMPAALPLDLLRAGLSRLRAETGLALRPLDSLPEAEALRATGLAPEALPAALSRGYDLPFLAPAGAGPALATAVGSLPGLALTRGGRFWHLSGRHDKADAFRALVESLSPPRPVAGLGDAENDAGFLSLCDVAVVVPPPSGPSRLAPLLPAARLAPGPGGEGWAAAVGALLEEGEP